MPVIKCSCGTWNDPSAIFCRNCGRNLRYDQVIQKQKESSSKTRAIIIIIIYYAVLVAIVAGIVMIFI